MSRADNGRDKPRAMIHRRILDVASSDAEASLESIAEDVSGASPTLVERVLDEYGDPARESTTDSQPTQDDGSMTAQNGTETEAAADDTVSLSEKQRRTLRALYERPDASQGELAEELDVTRATVSRRLNAIPGFDWENRRAFAESVFGGTAGTDDPDAGVQTVATDADETDEPTTDDDPEPATDGDSPTTDDDTSADTVESGSTDDVKDGGEPVDRPADGGGKVATSTLASRLAAIESRLETLEREGAGDDGATGGSSLPPELAHKVVHACMESDRITEEEELDVLRSFMQG